MREQRLGIAVTTMNRLPLLLVHLEQIKALTTCEYDLVICDDGSTDGTVETLRAAGYQVITGRNTGIAWNKNRGLFYLHATLGCDVVIILEDDVKPIVRGWQQDWIEAVICYGHVTFATVPVHRTVLGGACTTTSPGFATAVSGQCMAFSRQALYSVGYMDTRFGRYGHEHTDLTLRCIRSGFGGFIWAGNTTSKQAIFVVIDGGLFVEEVPSSFDPESLDYNTGVFQMTVGDQIYRHAWRNDVEMRQLIEEISTIAPVPPRQVRLPPEVSEREYVEANPDIELYGYPPREHFINCGITERRRLKLEH